MHDPIVRSSLPSWLAEYRRSFDRKRDIFLRGTKALFLSEEASQKYNTSGIACAYYGCSLVYFLRMDTPLYRKLTELSGELIRMTEEAGIRERLYFLPPETFHITFYDIAVLYPHSMEGAITDAIGRAFAAYKFEQPGRFTVNVKKDIVISDGASVLAPIEPADEQTMRHIFSLRRIVAEQMLNFSAQIPPKDPQYFAGHVTLAYIVQNVPEDEYGKLLEIMRKYKEHIVLGTEAIEKIELRRFDTMEDWGSDPLLTYEF